MFARIYDRVMLWSRHRRAPYYLGGLSFFESFFLLPPPDVMLAPMAMAKRNQAWWFALLTTVASVLGGVLGYVLGMYFFQLIYPWMVSLGYEDSYHLLREWFERYGFWGVFLGAVTPLPYKVFTITAGVMTMNIFLFVFASLIGRGMRFFLVAGLMAYGGERMEKYIKRNVNRFSWIVLLVVGAYLILHRWYQ